MKNKEYTSPTALEIEVSSYKMICASIGISDEETNGSGRVSRQERNGWENGLWNN